MESTAEGFVPDYGNDHQVRDGSLLYGLPTTGVAEARQRRNTVRFKQESSRVS